MKKNYNTEKVANFVCPPRGAADNVLPVKTVTLCRRPIIPFIKHTCHAHENLLNKSGQFSPTKLRFLELIQLRSIIVMATYQLIRGHQPYLTTSQMYKYKRSVNTIH